MRSIIATACLWAAITATAAASDIQQYWGAAYTSGEYEYEGIGGTDITGAQLLIGSQILPFLSIEGRAGSSLQTSTKISNVEVKTQVQYWASAFARLSANFDRVRPYALLGYTTGRAKASVPSLGLEDSDTDQDFSYGVGIELYADQRTAAFVEWVQYFETDLYTIDAWALGMSTRF